MCSSARVGVGEGAEAFKTKLDVHPQSRFVKSQDRIAQRPVMVRWNRDAESTYMLKELMRTYVTERS